MKLRKRMWGRCGSLLHFVFGLQDFKVQRIGRALVRLGAVQLFRLQIQNCPSVARAIQVFPISKFTTQVEHTVLLLLAEVSEAVVGQVVESSEPLTFHLGIIRATINLLHDEVRKCSSNCTTYPKGEQKENDRTTSPYVSTHARSKFQNIYNNKWVHNATKKRLRMSSQSTA